MILRTARFYMGLPCLLSLAITSFASNTQNPWSVLTLLGSSPTEWSVTDVQAINQKNCDLRTYSPSNTLPANLRVAECKASQDFNNSPLSMSYTVDFNLVHGRTQCNAFVTVSCNIETDVGPYGNNQINIPTGCKAKPAVTCGKLISKTNSKNQGQGNHVQLIFSDSK